MTSADVTPGAAVGTADLVAVIGAGTMGAGIAQVAAVAGHPVLIYDAAPGAAENAIASVRERLVQMHAKGRLTIDPESVSLNAAGSLSDLAGARVVVEAIIEDLAIKRGLFADLEKVVSADCILGTNTSSLSPTAIGAKLEHPGRVIGLHFFNPAPLMKLVEVVPGLATDPGVTQAVVELATAWGKTVVQAAATPGFIVNRVARPFYAEAWRLYEERAADYVTIDAVLVGAGGFRMGPFTLMDVIGHDVNEAVTRSVWAAFGNDPRFSPALAQRALVEAGWLGRKSGRGCYDYSESPKPPAAEAAEPRTAPASVTEYGTSGLGVLIGRSGVLSSAAPAAAAPYVELPSGARLVRTAGATATELAAQAGAPVIVVDRTLEDSEATAIAIAASPDCSSAALEEAIGLLQAAGLAVFVIDDVAGLIVARTVAMLVNVAVDALHRGVATAADIDTAMQLGTNYPLGPLKWGQRWDLRVVLALLDALLRTEGDPRYRASTLLRRSALSGATLV